MDTLCCVRQKVSENDGPSITECHGYLEMYFKLLLSFQKSYTMKGDISTMTKSNFFSLDTETVNNLYSYNKRSNLLYNHIKNNEKS